VRRLKPGSTRNDNDNNDNDDNAAATIGDSLCCRSVGTVSPSSTATLHDTETPKHRNTETLRALAPFCSSLSSLSAASLSRCFLLQSVAALSRSLRSHAHARSSLLLEVQAPLRSPSLPSSLLLSSLSRARVFAWPPKMTVATYTRADVAKHDKYDDAWIIIDNGVYDISKWIDKHPGGKVLLYYRGQDATEPVYAFHPDMEKTRRYMKATYIGELADPAVKPIVADFRKLREEVCARDAREPSTPPIDTTTTTITTTTTSTTISTSSMCAWCLDFNVMWKDSWSWVCARALGEEEEPELTHSLATAWLDAAPYRGLLQAALLLLHPPSAVDLHVRVHCVPCGRQRTCFSLPLLPSLALALGAGRVFTFLTRTTRVVWLDACGCGVPRHRPDPGRLAAA